MTADDVLFQIVAASAKRRPAMRPPSLAGFGHSLRIMNHRQHLIAYSERLGVQVRLEGGGRRR